MVIGCNWCGWLYDRTDPSERGEKFSLNTWDRGDPSTFGKCSTDRAAGVRDTAVEVFTVRKQNGSTCWT